MTKCRNRQLPDNARLISVDEYVSMQFIGPGPYLQIESTNGVDKTFEIICQTTRRCIIRFGYWDDPTHARAAVDEVLQSLNHIRDFQKAEFLEIPALTLDCCKHKSKSKKSKESILS